MTEAGVTNSGFAYGTNDLLMSNESKAVSTVQGRSICCQKIRDYKLVNVLFDGEVRGGVPGGILTREKSQKLSNQRQNKQVANGDMQSIFFTNLSIYSQNLVIRR